MKKMLFSLLIIGMLFAMGGKYAYAEFVVPNGGFETGTFEDWNVDSKKNQTNVVTEITAYNGILYQTDDGDYFASIFAGDKIWNAAPINWKAGETLKFNYAFLSMDQMPNNDFGFFQINRKAHFNQGSDNILFETTLSSLGETGDYGDTGWRTFAYTFETPGSGYFYFGADNGRANNNDSVLLIDYVHDPPSTTNPLATPEPATLFLFGAGLIGIAGFGRRFKQK